jgi:hypothetical protein
MKTRKRKEWLREKRIVLLVGIMLVLMFAERGLSVGLSYEAEDMVIHFEPGLKTELVFDLRNVPENMRVNVSLVGELAGYFRADWFNERELIVYIDLPKEIDSPGENVVYLTAKEVLADGSGLVAATTAVRVPISIVVPYPGRYLDVDLRVFDVERDSDANFEFVLNNVGEKSLYDVKGTVNIYDSNNETVSSTELSDIFVNKASKEVISVKKNIKKSGVYRAVIELDYGGDEPARSEKEFRVGKMLVEILDCTSVFEKGGIVPFDIKIGNEWSTMITDVYADVTISDSDGEVVDSFRTPSVDLSSWGEVVLAGFFDASGVVDDIYFADVVVHYGEENVAESVKIRSKRGTVNIFYLIYSVFLVMCTSLYCLFRIKRMRVIR